MNDSPPPDPSAAGPRRGERTLVTGSNGFVGRRLCQQLARRGHVFRMAHRNWATASQPGGDGVGVGTVDADTDWTLALSGVSHIVHLAALVHTPPTGADGELAAYRAVNTQGTLNLALQAARVGVKRFVLMSSIKVMGEDSPPGHAFTEAHPPAPADAYGLSKLEAEQGLLALAKDHGMEVVIIRPPLVYGPGVKANFAALMHAVQRGVPLPLASVRNRRSLVALDNLVDFCILCLVHPDAANQVFLVSDGEDLSTPDLIRGLAHAAGTRARLWSLPVPLLRRAAGWLGKSSMIERLCGDLHVDIAKARRTLGWTPPLTVAEGLRRAVGSG